MSSRIEKVNYGNGAKLSISITRKTPGDYVLSQHGIEHYFASDSAAGKALQEILAVLAEQPSPDGDGDGGPKEPP